MALYNKERLTHARIEKYLLNKFPTYTSANSVDRVILDVTPFAQRDYGNKGDGDCTLCSIMA